MTISGFHYVCFTCAPVWACPRMLNLCVRTKKVHTAVTVFGMNVTPYPSLLSKHNLHETRVISERGLEIINTLVCFGTQEPQGGGKSKTKQKLADKQQKRQQVVSTHTDCETMGIQVCICYWPDWDANCMWYCAWMCVSVFLCLLVWACRSHKRENILKKYKNTKLRILFKLY